jgi:hypothetical protein
MPLGFMRTPKPLIAPSPLSQTKVSRSPGSGQMASTTRLVGLAMITFETCFANAGEAGGSSTWKIAANMNNLERTN